MEKPTLETLPVETLEGICDSFNNTAPLKNLRLASRELCAKTQNVFARRQFTNLDFCSSKNDFEKLVAISKHPIYSKTVRALRVRPSYGPNIFSKSGFTKSRASAAYSEESARTIFEESLRAQKLWRNSYGDVDLLETAFQNLAGLRRVDVGFQDSEKAIRRRNEATGQLVNIRRGLYSPDQPQSRNSASHGFWIVLAALNRTKLDIKEIHAGVEWYAIEPKFLEIPHMWTGRLRVCFRNITVLSLGIDASSELLGEQDERIEDDRLANFLSKTPELHSLSLYFELEDLDAYLEAELEERIHWIIREVCKSTYLPKLENLKLEGGFLVAEELIDFLIRHRGRLRSLVLDDVCAMFPGNKLDHDLTPALGEVLAKLPRLNSLCLSRITTDTGRVLFGPEHSECEYCAFPEVPDPPCSGSEVQIKGEAVHSTTTAELLTSSRLKLWMGMV